MLDKHCPLPARFRGAVRWLAVIDQRELGLEKPMIAKTRSDVTSIVLNGASRSRALGLKLRITDRDLAKKIKIAIELAQSWRQDLDITFNCAR